MRPLRHSLDVTLSGCRDHEAGLPPDEESMGLWTAEMARAEALLFGRRTYAIMESAWRKPTTGIWTDWTDERGIPFAQTIDHTKKYGSPNVNVGAVPGIAGPTFTSGEPIFPSQTFANAVISACLVEVSDLISKPPQDDERVGDQPPMAPPPYRLATHDGRHRFVSGLHQVREPGLELTCRHVVGIIRKSHEPPCPVGSAYPAGVRRRPPELQSMGIRYPCAGLSGLRPGSTVEIFVSTGRNARQPIRSRRWRAACAAPPRNPGLSDQSSRPAASRNRSLAPPSTPPSRKLLSFLGTPPAR